MPTPIEEKDVSAALTYFGTLHVSNNHFVLAVIDASKEEVYELDPFAGQPSSLRSHVQTLYSVPEAYTVPQLVCLPLYLLLTLLSQDSQSQYFPRQKNSFDCGVICSVLTAGIASGHPLTPLLQEPSETLRAFVRGNHNGRSRCVASP